MWILDHYMTYNIHAGAEAARLYTLVLTAPTTSFLEPVTSTHKLHPLLRHILLLNANVAPKAHTKAQPARDSSPPRLDRCSLVRYFSPASSPNMVVVGSNTRNGKAIPSDRNPDRLRLKREEEKRVANLEHVRLLRFYKRQPNYTNRELAESAFETPVIQRDRYAFGEKLGVRIPHPKNIVFTATKKLLAEFNRTDLHRQLDPLAVEALSDLPTICHARETESTVFLLGRVQTFVKLQLKLVREFDAPGAAMIVMVRVGGQRHSLRAWLETLPKHRMPNIERLALDLQHQQWRGSGQPFRFERFPAEIRSRILLFAVGPYIEPRHPHKRFM